MKKVNYGVIGVGHLGTFHAQLAQKIDQINLVGLYDIDTKKAQEVASTCQTKVFSSLEQLLAQVEAVSIVVPTIHHYQTALKALEYNCHLFIEKPITSTNSQARELISLCQKKELKLQVGHIERFNPAMLAIKDYPLQPMFIESHRLSQFNPRGTDVSVILDLMIHDIDIILHMVKSPLASIDACGVAVVSDSEDIANVRLRFANGCVANLTSSRISVRAMRKMRIFQKNQYIAIDFLKKKSEIFKLEDCDSTTSATGFSMLIDTIGIGEKKKNIIYEQPEVPEVNSLQAELEEFVQAILLDREPPVTGEQGLQALEVATTILHQIHHPKKTKNFELKIILDKSQK